MDALELIAKGSGTPLKGVGGVVGADVRLLLFRHVQAWTPRKRMEHALGGGKADPGSRSSTLLMAPCRALLAK